MQFAKPHTVDFPFPVVCAQCARSVLKTPCDLARKAEGEPQKNLRERERVQREEALFVLAQRERERERESAAHNARLFMRPPTFAWVN